MTDKRDNVKIEINIAGEMIMLTVPFEKQESVRDCELAVNRLYNEWRARFSRKTNTEILAMIAYQYASYFNELSERYKSLSKSLDAMSEGLDRTLSEAPEANDDID